MEVKVRLYNDVDACLVPLAAFTENLLLSRKICLSGDFCIEGKQCWILVWYKYCKGCSEDRERRWWRMFPLAGLLPVAAEAFSAGAGLAMSVWSVGHRDWLVLCERRWRFMLGVWQILFPHRDLVVYWWFVSYWGGDNLCLWIRWLLRCGWLPMICKSEWCEREVKEYDGFYAGGRSVSDVICSVVLSSRRN